MNYKFYLFFKNKLVLQTNSWRYLYNRINGNEDIDYLIYEKENTNHWYDARYNTIPVRDIPKELQAMALLL